MSKHEKLLVRFLSKPKDFKYNELKRLLGYYNFTEVQAEGSRVVFKNVKSNSAIKLHKPHPISVLKGYQLDLIESFLKEKGFI
ncbi:MAG: type II toxin-antitoxin system HicA family toxin [Chlorobi bacterium]|nr:type II toxin-antitoxin system HicA family toxin [Chlorobiota bacterium]